METQHHDRDSNASAWYLSTWFVLILILAVALLTIWFTFARNAAQERLEAQDSIATQVQPPGQLAMLPVSGLPELPVLWS